MIKIQNVYKRYHNHHGSDWVLKDINLTIPPRVSVGLIGRNGAGKSTLLRLIGGMDSPDRGEIQRHCRVSWPIGLGGGFQGSMTGRQNVKFVARIHNHGKDSLEIIKKVEEFAEIGPAFDEPVKTYSSGMRARLQFGLSLAFKFDVYLSDEATAVGDRAFKAKAKKAFADRIAQASLIMVSHGEGTLKEMCQAGIFLDNGKATWYDDITDAIKAYHNAYDVKQAKGKATKNVIKKSKASGKKTTLQINKEEVEKIALEIENLESQRSQAPASIDNKIRELKRKLSIHDSFVKQLEEMENNNGKANT